MHALNRVLQSQNLEVDDEFKDPAFDQFLVEADEIERYFPFHLIDEADAQEIGLLDGKGLWSSPRFVGSV